MPNLDERFKIIDEMMGLYMQQVSEDRVKGYLRHLKGCDTDKLRAAVAGCVEHGSQRGAPTVAEILRRAMDLGTRRRDLSEPLEEPRPRYVECRKLVARTPFGSLLCCREQGHMGDCEVWFSYDGPRPEDAEIIDNLMQPREPKPRVEGFRPVVEEDTIPF